MRHYYLQQMGITPWLSRTHELQQNDLQKLEAEVANCTRCPLHLTRTQTVFARGNTQAKLMIIGEAPGANEDQQGLPFVGAAGALLDKMVTAIGLTTDQIYIANVLKCRPPNNRNPQPEEISQCQGYLAQQIAQINPTLILALGRFASQYLLNTSQALAQLRGKNHEYQGKRVIVTYHPAYLLRQPADKKAAYQDWLRVKTYLIA